MNFVKAKWSSTTINQIAKTAGVSVITAAWIINDRDGIDRNQDQLPPKFFQKPLKGGPTDGWKIGKSEFDAALEEYYQLCGWDLESGAPLRETLDRLDIDWAADNI